MKFIMLIILAFGLYSCSEEKTYLGKEPIYMGEPLTVKELLGKKLLNSTVQVSGKIYNVCKTEGCWFVMKQDQTSLRCTFESPTIFMDTVNLHTIMKVEGKLREEIIDGETSVMYAEQAGEEKPIMEGNKKRVPVFVVSTILLKQ
jgi:aspartyl/asparaginyl-tRNA synthetase